jgi:hypothetical protein
MSNQPDPLSKTVYSLVPTPRELRQARRAAFETLTANAMDAVVDIVSSFWDGRTYTEVGFVYPEEAQVVISAFREKGYKIEPSEKWPTTSFIIRLPAKEDE